MAWHASPVHSSLLLSSLPIKAHRYEYFIEFANKGEVFTLGFTKRVSADRAATVTKYGHCLLVMGELDNRGSSRRGIKFESAIKYNMGHIDIEDQEVGVQCLIRQGLLKADRIGIYGWSYRGYLAAMALARCPKIFECAVAGAPVIAWDGYDTYYTEKYMGTPSSNQAGFEFGSIMHHVHKIEGKLLLVHGMTDENVHFRHTA